MKLTESQANSDRETNLMIDEFIDKLTESIEDAQTGRSFPTEISLTSMEDLSGIGHDGWRFDWVQQLSEGEVYKLKAPKLGRSIHGLISISRGEGFVQVNLIESHPDFGANHGNRS